MTFDEWWESATDGWYLGRMASDDEKRYAQVAWDAATKAEQHRRSLIAAAEEAISAQKRIIEHDGPLEAHMLSLGGLEQSLAELMRSNVDFSGSTPLYGVEPAGK